MLGKQLLVQPFFVSINLNDFVPKGHRLRRVAKVLDLSFIHDLTKDKYCLHNGRTSIDPVVFFKMQIIKYLYGIASDRQLCSEIHVNLAYRWFLRYSLEDKVPDHSALTRIRDRLGENLFREVFERIVFQCEKAGLIKGEQLITDGTLIEADAAVESITKRQDQSGESADVANGKEFEQKRVSIRTHESSTDPDASMVSRKGKKPHLYYKGHVTIDGKARVITDCHITTGSTHECTQFVERAEEQMKSFDLKPGEWLADKGYGLGPIYEYLGAKKITPYIPLRDEKLGRGKHAPTEGFIFNRRENTYTCPAGKTLHPNKPANGFTRYTIKNKECFSCPLQASCLTNNAKGRASKRIQRADHQDLFNRIHRRRKTTHFKRKLTQRAWKIEGVFAELKENHGLSRAHYRGKSKMQIQMYMIAFVHNLKRLAKTTKEGLLGLNLRFLHFMALIFRKFEPIGFKT